MTNKPIDLTTHRERQQAKKGQEAHARGEAFAFAPYAYDDDGFGTIDTGEIIIVLDPVGLTGIRMSREDALRTGAALIQAAVGPVEEPPLSTATR